MGFHPPAWAPRLTDADIPDDLSLADFLFDDRHRPRKCQDSPPPFIDSVDGSGHGVQETRQRIEWLAAGLASQLGIEDVTGDHWGRVIGLFTVNNVSCSLFMLRIMLTRPSLIDPYPCPCLGHPSPQRCCRSGQCGFQGIRAGVPAQGFGSALPVHRPVSLGGGP